MTKKKTGAKYFEPFLKAKEDLEKKIQNEGRTAVKLFFKDYFEQHPKVYGIKWTQYTPYFNDGDVCEFGLFGVYSFPTREAFETDELYDYECCETEPEATLSLIQDVLEVVFGDHAEVSVTRDEITVQEYEHE